MVVFPKLNKLFDGTDSLQQALFWRRSEKGKGYQSLTLNIPPPLNIPPLVFDSENSEHYHMSCSCKYMFRLQTYIFCWKRPYLTTFLLFFFGFSFGTSASFASSWFCWFESMTYRCDQNKKCGLTKHVFT